jgi:hypothetical protein
VKPGPPFSPSSRAAVFRSSCNRGPASRIEDRGSRVEEWDWDWGSAGSCRSRTRVRFNPGRGMWATGNGTQKWPEGGRPHWRLGTPTSFGGFLVACREMGFSFLGHSCPPRMPPTAGILDWRHGSMARAWPLAKPAEMRGRRQFRGCWKCVTRPFVVRQQCR